MANHPHPFVGIVMGSESDWEPVMSHASSTLTELCVPHEKHVISAHRTPKEIPRYAASVIARNIRVIIAGAGGAAHLPGMMSAELIEQFAAMQQHEEHLQPPVVLGVPVMTEDLGGLDSLLSIVQMPPNIPVGTMSIGKKGAINAAVFAAQILSGEKHPEITQALIDFHRRMRCAVEAMDQRISVI